MGCVDCGGDNNWDNCDALEIEKGTCEAIEPTPANFNQGTYLRRRFTLLGNNRTGSQINFVNQKGCSVSRVVLVTIDFIDTKAHAAFKSVRR